MAVHPKTSRVRTWTFPALLRSKGIDPRRLSLDTDVGVQTILAAGRGVMPGRLALKALAVALDISTDELRACVDRSDGWRSA